VTFLIILIIAEIIKSKIMRTQSPTPQILKSHIFMTNDIAHSTSLIFANLTPENHPIEIEVPLLFRSSHYPLFNLAL